MTSLNPVFTIGDQIAETLEIHRASGRAAAREAAVELLRLVGLPAPERQLDRYPHQLSGGQRQRVMIAIALACRPRLLIADEPTTALDVTVQAQILRLLLELQKDLGLAILLITHDLGVVARMAHHVSVMYAGEVVESAPVAALFGRPTHPYTRGLLSCVPVPGRTRRDGRLGSIAGVVPRITADFAGCGFRDRCAEAAEPCARAIAPASAGADHAYLCRLKADWTATPAAPS